MDANNIALCIIVALAWAIYAVRAYVKRASHNNYYNRVEHYRVHHNRVIDMHVDDAINEYEYRTMLREELAMQEVMSIVNHDPDYMFPPVDDGAHTWGGSVRVYYDESKKK